MNSFIKDRFKRESVISSSSSLSKDSIDSQLSILLSQSNSFGYQIEENRRESILDEESKEKISFSEQILFFAPLILCLILLISGIVIFIIIEQRNNKNKNKEIQFNYRFNLTPNDNFMPILCPFVEPTKSIETVFALKQLECGLRRSSIIHIYYSNNPRPINPGQNLTTREVLVPPIIQLNYEFLSKVNAKSFVLILIDPIAVPTLTWNVILHWIRYFSSSLEDEEDICSYKSMNHMHIYGTQKIILLYATNSSQMMIRAKTFCNVLVDWFQLTEYVTFIQLKLIGSTNFFIPYLKTSD